MARPSTPEPTAGELAILSTLWTHGPSTVEQVRRNLPKDAMASVSVERTLRIMEKKGLLRRDASQRPQVYRPAAKKEHVQRQVLRRLVQRVFEGSPVNLLRQLVVGKKLSAAERHELLELLDAK